VNLCRHGVYIFETYDITVDSPTVLKHCVEPSGLLQTERASVQHNNVILLVLCPGSESDLMSIEHNLPLFMNCNANNDTDVAAITAVSLVCFFVAVIWRLIFTLTCCGVPFPSYRQHLSYDDCLIAERVDNQNCSVLCCVRQLCTLM